MPQLLTRSVTLYQLRLPEKYFVLFAVLCTGMELGKKESRGNELDQAIS